MTLPGAFGQHSAPETWFSPRPTPTLLSRAQALLPAFLDRICQALQHGAPFHPLQKAVTFGTGSGSLGMACLRIRECSHTYVHASSHAHLKPVCSPTELLRASHPSPPLSPSPSSSTTKATGNSSPQQHRRHNVKPRGRLRCHAVLSL